MRINNISPISFGYSKKSQAYLDKHIQTLEDKDYAGMLSKFSSCCNETEDIVRLSEKKKTDDAASVAELFVAMKDALLTTVMLTFEDCEEYLQSEYDYYSFSLNKCKNQYPDNWRSRLLDKLRFWDLDLGKTKEDLQAELRETKLLMAQERKRLTETLSRSETTESRNAGNLGNMGSTTLGTLERTETSPKGFSDIMGMEDLKRDFIENIVEPVNDPELRESNLREYGKKLPKGVLLYGPPGCGKTFIIEALASEIDTDVYVMDVGSTGSKFINQTSNNIKRAFDFVKQKGDESEKPVILFMDEMDSLTFNRSSGINEENLKQVATLLKSIEEAQKHNVIVVGASNKFDLIDPAIRRRFDMKRYVGLPNADQRELAVRNNLKKKSKAGNILADDKSMAAITKALEGYSYNSVNIISDEASINAMRRNRADISYEDFMKAIKETNEEKINEKEYKPKDNKQIGFMA